MKIIDKKFLRNKYYYKTPTGKSEEGRRDKTYAAAVACKGWLYYTSLGWSGENKVYGYVFACDTSISDNSVVYKSGDTQEYIITNKIRDDNELSEIYFHRVDKK
jgi:hypothetical protein